MPVSNDMLAELIRVQSRNAIASTLMKEAGRLASLRNEPGTGNKITQEDIEAAAIAYQFTLNMMPRKGLWLDAKPE